MTHWFHRHTRLAIFGKQFSVRNVLMMSVCIEVACVATGLLVYEWQQREMVYKLELERTASYEQLNDLLVELVRLRNQAEEKNVKIP